MEMLQFYRPKTLRILPAGERRIQIFLIIFLMCAGFVIECWLLFAGCPPYLAPAPFWILTAVAWWSEDPIATGSPAAYCFWRGHDLRDVAEDLDDQVCVRCHKYVWGGG